MKRADLEHLIRAAAEITNEYELIVIGSQSILGAHPNAPAELLLSNEADIYPKNRPDLADLIDGAIGELSPFDEHFGYYAQGVGPETAILPSGWQDRLVPIQNANTNLKVGYCLDPTDLAASKLVAHRPKDIEFVVALLRHALIDAETLQMRVAALPLPPERIAALNAWVETHSQPPLDHNSHPTER